MTAVRRYGGTGVRWLRLAGLLFLALILLIPNGSSAAQDLPPYRRTAVPPSEPGSDLTVYLMTMGPGKRVWERFGHNAIWIHDPVKGTDQAYNYGLFDLRQENFLLRFVQGRMWYWMQGFPAQAYIEQYRRANRSVWVQELEVAPKARRELQQFLEWNERPENRFYHYDYYLDNCSTRVRDALDRALGGRLGQSTKSVATGRTFRFHTLRLTSNDPLVYTGLMLGLGQPVDRPISLWEEMFLPLAMREHLRTLTVRGPNGQSVPLVRSERTLFQSTDPTPPSNPPRWLPFYLCAGLGVGGAAYGLATLASQSGSARVSFLMLTWIWVLLTGLAGLVLAGLWGFTDHTAAYYNENILQMNLLALPLVWLLPGFVRGKRSSARLTLALARAVAALSVVGLVLKLLPQFYQINGQVIALALPVHLGVAAGLWRVQTRAP